jgi:microcystin degradation protein MlrC
MPAPRPAPRVAIGGFQHETNTFAPMPTTWPEFEAARAWPGYTEGAAIFPTFAGLNLGISGFIEAASGWDLVPLLWCEAAPSGTVEQATFERITGRMAEMLAEVLAAGPLDAVYLDLHGAMVTDDHPDGEAEILARVRAVVGPDLPVAVSLDLHGNLSRAFFERASCVAIYRTYPHVDFAETGARAARLLARLLDRGRPFARAWRQLDYIIPITEQSTRREPGGRLYGMLPGLGTGGVASIDMAMGFPPADIPDNGATIFAYGDDQAAVDRAADTMLAALNAAEDEFHNPLAPAPEAVRQAMRLAEKATRPVVIADPQDNPGAGGPGDSTGLLRAMLDEGARGAALSMLWDPDTAAQAHRAGQGAEIEASLGGRFPEIGGGPVRIRAVVETLSDGVVPLAGPVLTGTANLGPMACLALVHERADLRVIVGTGRCQNADLELFRALGVVPETTKILAVKSAVHFLGAYEPIAEAVIFAEAPGANPCRMDRLPFTRLRPGVRLGPRGPVFRPG